MIYLDNAATSRKKAILTLLSAEREAAFGANAGRGGHVAAIRAAKRIERTREEIRKRFFDGSVVFTKNCTEAVNLALRGLPLRGKVVTSVFDHNAVLRTLKDLEDKGKIRMLVLMPENGSLEGPLKRALRQGDVSLVAVTARSNVTGMSTGVERLASITKRYSHALFFVDVAQSAGHDVISYENVDLIAASGHKGLGGLQGSGFLLMKDGLRPFPLVTGGTGTSGRSISIPLDIPEGLEAGTQNAVSIVSLYYAVRHAFRSLPRTVRKAERLASVMKSVLKTEPRVKLFPSENGIVLLNVRGKDSGYVADELSSRFRICARGGLHCAPLMHEYLGTSDVGAVRFSFGENNHLWHAIYAAYAVKRIASGE